MDVIANLKKARDAHDHYSGEWNAVDWVMKWLRPTDRKKPAPPPPTKSDPLRLSVVFAQGSIVGRVEPAEVGDEVPDAGANAPEEYKAAKRLGDAFVAAGFVCKIHDFSPRLVDPQAKGPRPAPAPVRAPFVHVLYLPPG